MKGTIQGISEPDAPVQLSETSSNTGGIRLKSTEVYRDLRLRGYHYGGMFRGILDASNTGNCLSLFTIMAVFAESIC